MKKVYPVVFYNTDDGYVMAYVPDFDIYTQGVDLGEAITMARDAIGINGIDFEDEQKALPEPTAIENISNSNKIIEATSACSIINLVDVDFTEYRRQHELRTVKKNCTLPSWLCYAAEKANINFSSVLQSALKKELHITE